MPEDIDGTVEGEQVAVSRRHKTQVLTQPMRQTR
jgi:hypothetical protein